MAQPESEQQRIARLARVRNNQRRCRARRQEYISELEQRLRDRDVSCTETIAEHQGSRQRLEEENKKLKELLAVVGVHPNCVEAYVKGGDSSQLVASLSTTLQVPQVNTVDTPSTLPSVYYSGQGTGPQLTEIGGAIENPETALWNGDLAGSTSARGPMLFLAEELQLSTGWQTAISFSNTTPTNGWAASNADVPQAPIGARCCASLLDTISANAVEETTPCSIAFQLIHQFNAKGSDIVEISLRLWRGFRKESLMGEGCRVDSRLLLEVLYDISNVSH